MLLETVFHRLAGLVLAFAAAAALAQPIKVTRISEPGPNAGNPLAGNLVSGIAVHVDLREPGLQVLVLPAGELLPSTPERTATQMRLATVSQAAERHGLDVAVNASFFGVAEKKRVGSREIAYFVGNPGYPVGWHVSAGTVHATPRSERLRASLVITRDGAARIEPDLREVPPDALHIVSGNALLLRAGLPTAPDGPAAAPRTAAGVSADGKTLILLALDGRQPGHSIGASLQQTAQILLAQGASDAINLDGGGSTALVLRDPVTGVHALANRPSDPYQGPGKLGLTTERPVADVIGVRSRVNLLSQK